MSYIELEKIRFDQRLEISFNIHNEIKGPVITPLILLPFIENSFKHGPSLDTEKAWITVDLMVKEGTLFFKVENSKAPPEPALSMTSNGAPGTALSNGFGLKKCRKKVSFVISRQVFPGTKE